MVKVLNMHPSDDLLDAYLLGNLSMEEKTGIEEHYLGCPHCVERLYAAEDFITTLKAGLAELQPVRAESPAFATIREDLHALGDLYSQIESLKWTCRGQEEILLRRMVQGSGLEYLDRIAQAYRTACSSREPPWDNFHEIRERACFWFHIGRLRLACALWGLRGMPRLCRSFAMRSLNALQALTPNLLDVMQASLPRSSSGIIG